MVYHQEALVRVYVMISTQLHEDFNQCVGVMHAFPLLTYASHEYYEWQYDKSACMLSEQLLHISTPHKDTCGFACNLCAAHVAHMWPL